MGLLTIIIRMQKDSQDEAQAEVDRVRALYPDADIHAPYESRLDDAAKREAERNAAGQAAQADMIALAAVVKADPTLSAAVEAVKAKAEALKIPE